ncbi:MAG: AAA family ATPase [Planctomycetota bacterium]|nr:AAA family ATPase [Planctomycetota bacterium]
MGYTTAFVGKGGVGKTTLAAQLVRFLVARKKGSVLAVDADPNNNLHLALGISAPRTIGEVREELASDTLSNPAISKERIVEYKLQELLVEEKGFSLLAMGRPEGQGCYCYVNHILRRYLDILQNDFSYVVIDTEAGMEHLSRRTTKDVDLMLIVSQPTESSLLAVERIASLARKLPISVKAMAVILNMVTPPLSEKITERIKSISLEIVSVVPYDSRISGFGIADENENICPPLESLFEGIASKKRF